MNTIKNNTDKESAIDSNPAKNNKCFPKNKKLQKKFKKALSTNKPIITLNFLFLGYLFQTNIADIALKINIIVQTIPIIDPAGVKEGRFMVLYQSIPPPVTNPPKTETARVIKGIIR
jgi:hypothetical protein